MKIAVAVAAGLVTLALSPVEAEPIPDRATGVWSLGEECSGGDTVVMMNSRAALVAATRNEKPSVAIARAEWLAGTIVLSFETGADELVLPPRDSLRKCAALPGMLPVVFAEALAVFRTFEDFDEACLGESGPGPRCAAVGFRTIDLTRDRRLSRAEIGRAIRAATLFVGYRLIAETQKKTYVPVDELWLAWLAGSALGPTVAGNLVDSYDYDNDDLVSLDELMQDRMPEEGLEGVFAGMAAEMVPDALSGVMLSAMGVLDLLR